MPLSAGTKLGPYEILAPIGVGGMGEVYRARDTRLGRDVAIKVSHEKFSDRFEREARAVAALNHPNICTLHDIGPNYLVLELIEGPTLADRIKDAPIPLEEALAISHQIAAALDAAHQKGIVHRDLKPANIKVSENGNVKVLDFGLAKTVEARAASGDPNNSPTLTLEATRAGTILGTAAYMSPEQARGRTVDKRADIWAFGVVLFEMFTGKRPFQGEDLTETLASVVKEDPRLDRAPAKVRRLLQKCLEKDPEKRLRDIGDAWLLLHEPAASSAPASPGKWIWLSGALALIVVGLGIFALVAFLRPAPPPELYRLAINPPPGLHFEFANNVGGSAISPDGSKIAFVAGGDLWIRPLDSETATKVPGTSGAYYPFWSPDQRFIGFSVRGEVVTVEFSSGSRTEVTSAGTFRGASWNADGTILFPVFGQGVFRVPSTGGNPVPVTKLDESLQEGAHYYPSFLSDGDHFLYMIRSRDPANSGVFVGSLKDPKLKLRVAAALSSAAFVPAAQGYPGYLVFAREGALLAQRFDESRLRPVGEPESLSASVGFLLNNQLANFSVSRTGTVVFGTPGTPLVQMTWLDRYGNATPVASPANAFETPPRLSHDGARVALFKYSGLGGTTLWSFDFKRGSLIRADEEGGFMAWSADDRQLLHFSGARKAYVRKDPSSAQPAEVVVKFDNGPADPIDWSPDGRFVVTGGEVLSATSGDPYPGKPFVHHYSRFSPDGKWLAYSFDGEVFAQEFPVARARIQVSNQGGGTPVWRRDMKEFFYRKGLALMSVDIRSTQSGLEFGIPHELFTSAILKHSECDAAPDGQRFLCLVPAPSNPLDDQLTVLLNWRERLRK